MASILDFQSIYEEDPKSIRARVEEQADDDIDLRVGEIFHDITQPIVYEIERLWDSINYYAALTFLPWANGAYLDYKGAYEIGTLRKTATLAVGTVTFIGELGTYIPNGTVVSDTPRLASDEAHQFQTLAEEEIGMLAPTTAPTSSIHGPGSIVVDTGALDPISYKVTFVGRGGETDPSPASSTIDPYDEDVLVSGIPTGPSGTTARNIYRQDETDGEYYFLATIEDNTTTTYIDSEDAALSTLDVDPAPATNTTDRVDIECQSLESGEDQNVGVQEIDQLVDSIDGVESVINAAAFTAGTDDETDEEYRARLVLALSSDVGQGNKSDYRRWATSVDGVADASVIPHWDGNNTVKVILVGPDNTAVDSDVVDEVQALLDPNIDGHGEGLAPIGAVVTVATVATVSIAVVATITHTDTNQYSLDGDNGTTATRADIVDAINAYLRSLTPGSDVIWAEMLARIVTVDGVADVSSFTINGGTSNVAIADNQVPVLTPSPTLTED